VEVFSKQGRKDAKDLAVHVVGGGGEEEQCAKDPFGAVAGWAMDFVGGQRDSGALGSGSGVCEWVSVIQEIHPEGMIRCFA
jgi:hypothetical protein